MPPASTHYFFDSVEDLIRQATEAVPAGAAGLLRAADRGLRRHRPLPRSREPAGGRAPLGHQRREPHRPVRGVPRRPPPARRPAGGHRSDRAARGALRPAARDHGRPSPSAGLPASSPSATASPCERWPANRSSPTSSPARSSPSSSPAGPSRPPTPDRKAADALGPRQPRATCSPTPPPGPATTAPTRRCSPTSPSDPTSSACRPASRCSGSAWPASPSRARARRSSSIRTRPGGRSASCCAARS